MNDHSGKVHGLKNLGQLLNLTPEEFERMIPDLRGWHELARNFADLLDVPYEDFSNSEFIWTDDGHPGRLDSARITVGEMTIEISEDPDKEA